MSDPYSNGFRFIADTAPSTKVDQPRYGPHWMGGGPESVPRSVLSLLLNNQIQSHQLHVHTELVQQAKL